MRTTVINFNQKQGIVEKSIYPLDAKQSLISYIMQMQNRTDIQDYPDNIEGIKQKNSTTYFYEDKTHNSTIFSTLEHL